ncbi:MAG: hypothetical protein R2757_03090 [Draconibacterium sp.]
MPKVMLSNKGGDVVNILRVQYNIKTEEYIVGTNVVSADGKR